MAKTQAVWGIDIGMCAIKALRCTKGDDSKQIIADKFDYIEFPKMLNQADVDPEEEIKNALELFLSRNDVKGDVIAISVPGQTGLPRFFRPPPVDVRTLPEIVKYEVKQQIPFPMDEVVWDWQRLGGVLVDDRLVDAEVGLFAMKREAVFKAMKPFEDAKIEIDFIQLSPLAVFNFVTHDVFDVLPNPDDIDPENPPESLVVLSVGTDTTDLIVTNGVKLWLRNIPVGGNHFTKQLSRELKLTHAKAEQLKRNARNAEDPKSLFRAMRPVFNDLVSEIQRSLTFFRSIDRNASLSKIVLLGNTAKLPGLRQFLTSQLEMDIVKVSELKHLSGADVVNQTSFQDNVLTFAPAYGLCIQGLSESVLKTNLLPAELKEERFIRAKKPWVLSAISMLMLGMLVGWFFYTQMLYRSSDSFEANGVMWATAKEAAGAVKKQSEKLITDDADLRRTLDKVELLNKELVSSYESKNQWIELMKAIHDQLPKDPRIVDDTVNPLDVPFEDRETIYIQHIESHFTKDVQKQIQALEKYYITQFSRTGEEDEEPATTVEAPQAATDDDESPSTPAGGTKVAGTEAGAGAVKVKPLPELSGPGWVIEIKGHHYHNSDRATMNKDSRQTYLRRTLLQSLDRGSVTFPGEENAIQGGGTYSLAEFGLYLPTLVFEETKQPYLIQFSPEPTEIESVRARQADVLEQITQLADKEDGQEELEALKKERDEIDAKLALVDKILKDRGIRATRYDFVVQMIWIPRSPSQRFAMRTTGNNLGGEAVSNSSEPINTPIPTPNEQGGVENARSDDDDDDE
jgi:type IV pilus assembly protein PilM